MANSGSATKRNAAAPRQHFNSLPLARVRLDARKLEEEKATIMPRVPQPSTGDELARLRIRVSNATQRAVLIIGSNIP